MPHIPAKQMADQKLRDADRWLLHFEFAAARYQGLVLLWLSLRCAFKECMRSRRISAERLTLLSMKIDEAHDFALVELESMRAAARNVRSNELASLIYYEEHQERES